MNYKNLIAGAFAFALAASTASCGSSKKENSPQKTDETETTTAADIQEATTEEVTEEATEEELVPPVPTECNNPDAVTFDNDDFSFAQIISDDDAAAVGELSIVEVMGNRMLKFADDNSVPLEGKVQKLSISAIKLIGAENLSKVRKIEFDLYAQATAANLTTDDAENVLAPGWIGGGGGTVTAKKNDDGEAQWYNFQEFDGGEYNFETSGAVHVQFKFLVADGGLCWDETMEDANFLIMRWGIPNEADLLIDNIIFYDADGNSIPLVTE